MFNNFYWAWEGVLDKDFCDYVINKMDWSASEKGAVRTEMNVNEKTRVTDVLWEEVTSPIAAVCFHYISLANELADWNFNVKYIERIQIGRYAQGGHYDWHIDTGKPYPNGLQRKLSCSIMLNDPSEYEGGLLEIKHTEQQVPTKQGSIVVFPSIMEHRVTPVTSGTRYSAVCWALGEPFK